MAEHTETLTIPVALAQEVQSAWLEATASLPDDLPLEAYWQQRIERGERLMAAYEQVQRSIPGASVLWKILLDATEGTRDRIRFAERSLAELRGEG